MEVREATSEVTLHSKEITIVSASFKSSDGTSNPVVEITYNYTLKTVKLGFENQIPAGSGSLVIKFEGILNGDMAGFYKYVALCMVVSVLMTLTDRLTPMLMETRRSWPALSSKLWMLDGNY